MPRESMGRVCLEYTDGDSKGYVYDKPYEPQSGIARHILGTFRVTSRWQIRSNHPMGWGTQEHPMRSFRIFFDSGHQAIARGVGEEDRCLTAYASAVKHDFA